MRPIELGGGEREALGPGCWAGEGGGVQRAEPGRKARGPQGKLTWRSHGTGTAGKEAQASRRGEGDYWLGCSRGSAR